MRKMIDYPRLYEWSAAHKRLGAAFRLLHLPSLVIIALFYAAHVGLSAYFGSLAMARTLLAVSGAPFLAVSVLRHILNAPRPYEVYELRSFGLDVPRYKRGCSFPSRHTFSAFLIGVLLLPDLPFLGAAALLIGVYLATSRVLLGIHFIRDVVAGAAIGTLAGVVGTLCVHFFC